MYGKLSNDAQINSPSHADLKNSKQSDFQPFWNELEFLSTKFRGFRALFHPRAVWIPMLILSIQSFHDVAVILKQKPVKV